MKVFILLLSMVVRSSGQVSLSDCGDEARRPQYSDIAVECGTSTITLDIKLCPVVYTGYNESLLILNHMMQSECRATIEMSDDSYVARFIFPLNMTHACGSVFLTTSAPGTGIFSDFSNIQTVNISGIVRSIDPTTGTVTYNAELKYYYSCAYPLEYLINNTQIDVSASSIAVRDNNGTFISTLSMSLYSDESYTEPLIIPDSGIELRSSVYVKVKATNLTSQYHVLLDRCYASISPLPTNSSFFNLFVPCNKDRLTTILLNGEAQEAHFKFQAFRFIEQQNETVSTYFLHCITRLCEKSVCSEFKTCNQRRKRSTLETNEVGSTDTYTLTSPMISTASDASSLKEQAAIANESSDSTAGLGAAVGVLAFICIVALSVAAVFYMRLRN